MIGDGDTAPFPVVEIWCAKTRCCMMVHTHNVNYIDYGAETPYERRW
jgi:hypothetical protein